MLGRFARACRRYDGGRVADREQRVEVVLMDGTQQEPSRAELERHTATLGGLLTASPAPERTSHAAGRHGEFCLKPDGTKAAVLMAETVLLVCASERLLVAGLILQEGTLIGHERKLLEGRQAAERRSIRVAAT
jgi:hypothetical protein